MPSENIAIIKIKISKSRFPTKFGCQLLKTVDRDIWRQVYFKPLVWLKALQVIWDIARFDYEFVR